MQSFGIGSSNANTRGETGVPFMGRYFWGRHLDENFPKIPAAPSTYEKVALLNPLLRVGRTKDLQYHQ